MLTLRAVLLLLLITGLTTHSFAQSEVEVKPDGTIILADFNDEPVGEMPTRWFNRDGDAQPHTYTGRDREGYHYRVQEEDCRKFLRYAGMDAKHLNLPILKTEEINIRETPVLSWDWRVFAIPVGGNEDSRRRNDVAASIYVVWGFNFLRQPRVVRYTWSSELDVGFETTKNMGNMKIKVVASGVENLGEWVTFQRNIVEDYERLFGRSAPERPYAILILSDADDTESFAKADYDNIKLLPNKR